MSIEEKRKETLWCAHRLFDRGLVRGSTGNISFFHEGRMYISPSGSSFGRLEGADFAVISQEGEILEGKPSKEYPLHLVFYRQAPGTGAVIHTHSLFSTAFSCRLDLKTAVGELFAYTPYLRMQTGGRIGMVDYYPPGSRELFAAFEKAFVPDTRAYLMGSHGIVAGAETAYKAFDLIEEFETSASIADILGKCEKGKIRTI